VTGYSGPDATRRSRDQSPLVISPASNPDGIPVLHRHPMPQSRRLFLTVDPPPRPAPFACDELPCPVWVKFAKIAEHRFKEKI